MTKTRNIAARPLTFAALATALTLLSCDQGNPLCCTEADFQVGGDITLEGEAGVALQAVADVAAVAAASLEDLTTACRAIAEDLEAPESDRKAAAATADKRERMDAWCTLAASAIASFKAQAGGSLTIDIQPPQCSASVSAKADCQASCSGSAECDVKANPPTCEGGKLEISCKGSCSAEGGASVSCQGSCSGECNGSCSAEAGGVECQGKCEGTCSASAMGMAGGGGTGIQADGTCDGTCEGTCEVVKPGFECSGSCNGECSGSCEASADVAVKCDGMCDGDFEPLKCEGGELKGGCMVEAECDANCNASASAKAECTPGRAVIAFSGAADIEAAGKLKAVLDVNLGLVASIKGRLEAMVDIVAELSGNVSAEALADVKVACIPVIATAVGGAVEDLEGSISGSAKIMASIN